MGTVGGAEQGLKRRFSFGLSQPHRAGRSVMGKESASRVDANGRFGIDVAALVKRRLNNLELPNTRFQRLA
jgi:hypothetical protein